MTCRALILLCALAAAAGGIFHGCSPSEPFAILHSPSAQHLPPRFQFLTRGEDLILGDTHTADAWLFTAGPRTSLWIKLPNPLLDTNRVLVPR